MKRLALLLLLSALPATAPAQQVVTRVLSGANYQTGSTYAFVAQDVTRITSFNNASGVAATLASGLTSPVFGVGSDFAVVNAGAGNVVITCISCTISGSATLTLNPAQAADIYGDGVNYIAFLEGAPGAVSSTYVTYPNSTDGTTCNSLVKADPTAGSTTLGRATDTVGGELLILGIVTTGCGTTGNATIAITGQFPVIFDSVTPTVGDAAGISISTAGAATDLGSANPTSGATIIGTLVLSPSGALPAGCTAAPGCYIQLQLGGGGGAGGATNALVSNPSTTAKNTIAPTGSSVIPISPGCNSGAGSSQPCLNVTDSGGNAALVVTNNDTVQIGKSTGATKNIESGTSSNTDLNGTLTMSSGTAIYTWTGSYTVHPTCTAADETAIAAVKVTYTSTTSVTFTTSGSADVIDYTCIVRN
jgi:hypothetical protein